MNKLLIFTISLFLLTNSSSLFSQEKEKSNALKISPIQFGKSFFEIGYEFGINGGKSAIQITPMIMLKRNDFEEFSGIQGELQYRNYLKRIDLEDTRAWHFTDIDLYAGAYALGLTYQEETMYSNWDPVTQMEFRDPIKDEIFAAEGGVFVGVKFVFSKRLCLDLLAGGGVRYSDITTENLNGGPIPMYHNSYSEVFDIGYYGVKPRLNLQLGIVL